MKINYICLISLAVIGDSLIALSFSSNLVSDIAGILCSSVLTLVLAVLLKYIYERYSKKQFYYKALTDTLIGFILSIILVWSGLYTAYLFSRYASKVMLDTKWAIIPFVLIMLLAVLIAVSKKSLLFKAGLILFPITALFILLMFGFSLPFMSAKYLVPYKAFEPSSALEIFLSFSFALLPAVIPAVVLGKKQNKKSVALAFGFGIGLILISAVGTLSVFGSEFASTLNYPYSYAVSTAEFGEIFSRLDGFLYSVCFFSCLIKISACFMSAFLILKRILSEILFRKI